jgi:hypothetical protein
MNKKSQVSIFIIIGLIIIILSSFFYIRFNVKPELIIDNGNEFKDVEKHIQECIKNSAIESIELLGKQGSLNPTAYIASERNMVSYYYFKGKGFVPEKKNIESQISLFIENKMYDCINKFSDNVYAIDAQEIRIFSEIENDFISIKLETPIRVYHHGRRDDIYIPVIELSTNLKKIYDTSKEMIDNIIKDPNWIDLEEINKKDLDIRMVVVNSSTIIYILTDNKIGLNKEPYSYRFAVKYDL